MKCHETNLWDKIDIHLFSVYRYTFIEFRQMIQARITIGYVLATFLPPSRTRVSFDKRKTENKEVQISKHADKNDPGHKKTIYEQWSWTMSSINENTSAFFAPKKL